MHRHPFDPSSAALGLLTAGLGIAVATDTIDDVGGSWGTWFAAAALLVGLAMVPWRRQTAPVVDATPSVVVGSQLVEVDDRTDADATPL